MVEKSISITNDYDINFNIKKCIHKLIYKLYLNLMTNIINVNSKIQYKVYF
jgi:hypothetical protein